MKTSNGSWLKTRLDGSAYPAEMPLFVKLHCFVSVVIFRAVHKEGKGGGGRDEWVYQCISDNYKSRKMPCEEIAVGKDFHLRNNWANSGNMRTPLSNNATWPWASPCPQTLPRVQGTFPTLQEVTQENSPGTGTHSELEEKSLFKDTLDKSSFFKIYYYFKGSYKSIEILMAGRFVLAQL